ncbi:dynein axonemal assembly factor 1-like [Physella acuta]|uniref:dynein axonemal assembly factor 1-like n=1 Tax=Physella acuta TaxID=109671 RepID=UPI0027DAD786|nr:dynein axonemal assembly factor 1-like [Physella acuta]XP_059144940.1 dynein axonemal assembly factor 1-like [Physella acuta]
MPLIEVLSESYNEVNNSNIQSVQIEPTTVDNQLPQSAPLITTLDSTVEVTDNGKVIVHDEENNNLQIDEITETHEVPINNTIKVEEKDNKNESEKKKYPSVLTEKFLKKHCKDLKLYQTPELNDVLYLHYKGIYQIENLEAYTGLKCLWLECNGISTIENLDKQTELRCLYLHQNLIGKLENLQALQKLDNLNVSHNIIKRIEHISCLPVLNTLNISHNKLQTADDLAELVHCPNLSILDVSYNHIDDVNVVDEVFVNMKNLRVLNLSGNPVTQNIKFYRKTLTVKLKNLQYLDDRPVFPKDRACAEAWAEGGLEAEKMEREKWATKEHQKLTESVDALLKLRKTTLAKKIQNELNEKNQREGNSEKVEVDEESIDWLYGTYKLKGDDTVYKRSEDVSERKRLNDEQTDEQSEDQNTENTDAKPKENVPGEEMEVIEVKIKAKEDNEEDSGIFSHRDDKPRGLLITDNEKEDADGFEDLPDLEDYEQTNADTEDKPYRPIIEILNDDEEENQDQVNSHVLSKKKVLIEDITVSISDSNLTDNDTTDSPQAVNENLIDFTQLSNKCVSPNHSEDTNESTKILITEMEEESNENNSPDNVQNKYILSSQEDASVARPSDKVSEDLLGALSSIADSKVSKDGVIDFSTPAGLINGDDDDDEGEKRVFDEELEGLD